MTGCGKMALEITGEAKPSKPSKHGTHVKGAPLLLKEQDVTDDSTTRIVQVSRVVLHEITVNSSGHCIARVC